MMEATPRQPLSNIPRRDSDFPGGADFGADVTRRIERIERELADHRAGIAAIDRKHASINLAVGDLARALAGLRSALARAAS